MTRAAQKARERQFFDQFQAKFGGPIGNVDDSGERPDIVVSGAHTVGIEVTELHVVAGSGPASWQRQGARRAEAIALARSQYEAFTAPRFEFHFDFRRPLPPELSIKELAAQCLGAARASLSMQGGVISPLVFEDIAPDLFWMYRSPEEYDDPRWEDLTVHSVPRFDPDRLQEVVEGKAKKLPAYRRCHEQWLLVVIDFWDGGQDQQLDWPPSAILRRHGFDRVFVFKTWHAAWIEPPSVPN